MDMTWVGVVGSVPDMFAVSDENSSMKDDWEKEG